MYKALGYSNCFCKCFERKNFAIIEVHASRAEQLARDSTIENGYSNVNFRKIAKSFNNTCNVVIYHISK